MKRKNKEKEIEEQVEQEVAEEQQINNEKSEEVTENSDSQKLAELNDRYLRLVAEFDNFRRRTAKERMDLVVNAAEDTIKGLLPVLDDFERAIDILSKSQGDIKAALEGTELIYNKLMVYLISKGLKKIEAVGEALDTDFHEAVAQFPVEEDTKKNRIIDVVQQGYTLNGKVIRFAKVVVGV
ncbi:MAG: nucleotide exchange factor GrpE [Bacteroidales bacterium]